MGRRNFAFLLTVLLLIVAVVPLGISLSNSSAGVGSSFVFVPSMIVPEGVDEDGNRIEDLLDVEIEQKIAEGNGSQMVNVVVLLDAPPSSVHNSAFRGNGGGGVRGPWQHAVYGFAGRLPYIAVSKFAGRCPNLLLVQLDQECEVHLAYATRQGRTRTYVWDTLGYKGDPQSSIAISDSGIDDSHVNHGSYGDADFSKKIVGWQDYVGTSTTPYDDNGHGSHCAGIAAGNGFYSTDGGGRAVATWSASFPFDDSGTYFITAFNVTKAGTVTLELKWEDTGSKPGKVNEMYLFYAGYSGDTGDWVQVDSVSTPNENQIYSIDYDVTSGGLGYYHVLLSIEAGQAQGRFSSGHILISSHWPYDFAQDGYEAWTGVANEAKLVGLKSMDSSGGGYTSDLVAGIDWAVANRDTYHILVLSMSWGFKVLDTTVDNAVSNAVGAGIVCVTSAGNRGSGANLIHTPGSNPYVISVAATSVYDNITSYSSQGGPSEVNSAVVKPDLAAPGGSFYYLPMLSSDSNDQDADNHYADFRGNDAAPMQGTSMSAPFISGCAAVVAQALGGYDGWNYSDNSMALEAKMLLLMTATETYPILREVDSSYSPSLDRGGKDVHEGYGRVNLDAAVEAAALSYSVGSVVSESFGDSPLDRKCWARNVFLREGVEYKFNLTVPSGADYDLYLYSGSGDLYGEPVILSKSIVDAVGGTESISYTPGFSGDCYVVVKRARDDTGVGAFTLESSPKEDLVYLLLESGQGSLVSGEEVTFRVTMFNEDNQDLNSTLSLTVTGPEGYYIYDFQTVAVEVDSVAEYSFDWVIPEAAGTYVVEVGLVPAQLTAYDAVWLEVG